MESRSRQKIPGGKLVEVRVEYGERILGVEIVGDFFMHPEEALGRIEDCLIGMRSGEAEGAMVEAIRKEAENAGVEMIGISPEAIAKAIKMAIG